MNSLRSILPVLFALAGAACAGEATVSAFPGAEGFGSRTPGGRGGRVLLVTNLNDSGPGSLREACLVKGPRVIVFRVGGVIDLKSDLSIDEPYITIAGQSAPGDGVCLRGYGLSVRTHDAVVRFLRVRPGDVAGQEVDAICVGGNSRNVMIDHCSATWSVDEAPSPSGAIANVTVQWCLIGEPLDKSVHPKGPHGYGSLVRAVGGVSMHHNLWVHNRARSPRLGDNYGKPPYPTFDVRNNVIYNFGDMASGLAGDVFDANYVANYVRPGPNSNRKRGIIVTSDKAHLRFYTADNVIEEGLALFDRTTLDGRELVTQVAAPFDVAPVRTTRAAKALEEVLDRVGAMRPVRDAVDRRIVNDVRTREGRIINSQRDVGGWPVYRSGPSPADSDSDGMPDVWERKHGLNARESSDAARRAARGPYTNIEVYLNELARR